MYSAVIFDLDGTLLNTLTDLANAGNHTLEVLGFPTHPVDAYRYLVGNGIPKLIERMLPEKNRGPATQQTALSIFLRYYEAHQTGHHRPLPRHSAMLQALKGAGLRLGVVSNKENSLSQEVAAHYFPGLFDAVAGHVLGTPTKPDPALLNGLMAQFGVQAGAGPVCGRQQCGYSNSAKRSCGKLRRAVGLPYRGRASGRRRQLSGTYPTAACKLCAGAS